MKSDKKDSLIDAHYFSSTFAAQFFKNIILNLDETSLTNS